MNTGQWTGPVYTCAAELHVSDRAERGLELTLKGSLLGLLALLVKFLPQACMQNPGKDKALCCQRSAGLLWES